MIRGDGPREPRAEIIDDDGKPLARSVAQPPVPIGQRPARAFATVVTFAAILVVIVFIGVSNRNPARPSGTPKVATSPLASLAPSLEPIFPVTAAGLPVVGVGTAQAIAADASRNGAELAVGGWYTAVRLVETCQPSLMPVGTCRSDWQAVVESPQPDVRWTIDGVSHPIVVGTASITPLFLEPAEPPELLSQSAGGRFEIVTPSPLVLIGHFHDDRLCAPSAGPSAYCTSGFVVDAIELPDGTVSATESPSMVDSTKLTSSAVVGLIRSHLRPGGFVLTYGALSWQNDPSDPPYVEPSTDGPAADGRTVWLVRGYVPGTTGSSANGAAFASWLAIDDGTGQVWGPLSTPAEAARPAAEFPPTMDGLTVQTVAAAVPNGPGSHGVIAVAGYLSNDRAVEGCPPAPTTDKPNPCSGTQLVLIDQPGPILVPNDATFLYEFAVPSNLPSIRPEILPGTTVDNPWQGLGEIAAETSSWPVVLIGQFGDPRSLECAPRPGGGNAACDRSFVVDQLPWIGGTGFGPSIFMGSGLRPSHSAPDVTSAVAGWFLPQSQPAVVSMTSTLPADSAALTGVKLEGRPKQLYWVVRVISNLPAGPASSLLVFDDRTLNLVEVSPGD